MKVGVFYVVGRQWHPSSGCGRCHVHTYDFLTLTRNTTLSSRRRHLSPHRRPSRPLSTSPPNTAQHGVHHHEGDEFHHLIAITFPKSCHVAIPKSRHAAHPSRHRCRRRVHPRRPYTRRMHHRHRREPRHRARVHQAAAFTPGQPRGRGVPRARRRDGPARAAIASQRGPEPARHHRARRQRRGLRRVLGRGFGDEPPGGGQRRR